MTERNRDASGGDIESVKRRYLLRTIGRFEDLDELRNLILLRRGDTIVRLSDVARVQLDHFEKRSISRYNGNDTFTMGAGVVDAGDSFINETTTDSSGYYEIAVDTGSTGVDYLVAVDSKSVPPNGASPFNVGFGQGIAGSV